MQLKIVLIFVLFLLAGLAAWSWHPLAGIVAFVFGAAAVANEAK